MAALLFHRPSPFADGSTSGETSPQGSSTRPASKAPGRRKNLAHIVRRENMASPSSAPEGRKKLAHVVRRGNTVGLRPAPPEGRKKLPHVTRCWRSHRWIGCLYSLPRYSGGGLGRGFGDNAPPHSTPSLSLPRSTGGGDERCSKVPPVPPPAESTREPVPPVGEPAARRSAFCDGGAS
jgi:hypothetical protein